MSEQAIATQGLSKDYGEGRGLRGLDLEIAGPEVFGYLGPNGAGKSTTIRLLMGMIRPTAGSARIYGLDCQTQAVQVKRRLGYLPGVLPDFGRLRGGEVVTYIGSLGGSVDRGHVASLTERLDLDLGRRYAEYSRGNKQKLGLVLAFMHRPDLLILDEPTGGLDPLVQQEFYRMVREARAAGATVFLSSHVLSEVEHVCDRVGIIRGSRLVKVVELSELHAIRVHRVEVDLDGPPPVEALRRLAGLGELELREAGFSGVLSGRFEPLLEAMRGCNVLNLASHEPSLEEVFLSYYREQAAPC